MQDNPDELSAAEKNFDIQFKQWEEQFNKWKEQNIDHPDKVSFLVCFNAMLKYHITIRKH